MFTRKQVIWCLAYIGVGAVAFLVTQDWQIVVAAQGIVAGFIIGRFL